MGRSITRVGFNFLLILGDIIFFNLAIVLAFLIRFSGKVPWHNFEPYLAIVPLISLAAVISFNFFGLYHTKNKIWSEISASLIISIVFTIGVTIILAFMSYGFAFPRSIFFIAPVIELTILGIWRWLMLRWERALTPPKSALIIAPCNEACALTTKVSTGFYNVLGVIVEKSQTLLDCDCEILGTYDQMIKICDKFQPDTLIVSGDVPEKYKSLAVQKSLKYNWQVLIIPGLYEIMLMKSDLEQIRDTMVVEINPLSNPGKQQIKRWFDCTLAGIGSIVTLPLMVIIALVIKLNSPGPILYRQERVSIRGKCFMLYKFRTMVDNAENQTGPVLSFKQDTRITRVGKFLRCTRLDELPQLFNILKGEMSLVGPRPERPCFVEKFEQEIPEYKYRHLTKPGLTGLAQIAGNYSTNALDKLRYDLLYIKDNSLLADLKIVLQTVKVLLMRNKAS